VTAAPGILAAAAARAGLALVQSWWGVSRWGVGGLGISQLGISRFRAGRLGPAGDRRALLAGRVRGRSGGPAATPAGPVRRFGHAPILPEWSSAAKADTVRNGSVPLRYRQRYRSVRWAPP
jgi:hypothetical protein